RTPSGPRRVLPYRSTSVRGTFVLFPLELVPVTVVPIRPGGRAPEGATVPAGRVLRLRLVQSVSRTLIGIRDRRHQTQRVRDDHSQGDRGDERDQKAVLHEILTPLVPDERLRELEHLMQPSLNLVIVTHPSAIRRRHFRRDDGRVPK